MRKQVAYLFIFFGLGFYHLAFAQQLHFQRYGIKEGLVHSGTGSREVIIQDKEGFIWFSTHHGISRFDGIEFKNFRYDPHNPRSIGNNWTVGIVEADDGKIWVGTADEGLFIFDPATESFEAVGSEEAGICGHGMNTLNKDKDGNIWIGTRFNGFCRWLKQTGHFEQVGNLRDGHHFYQQKDGTVWLGEWHGLFKMLQDGTFKLMPFPPGLPNDWRYQVIQDQVELPNGRFLLTSSFEAFWEFDPITETFRDLTKTFQFKNAKVPYSFLADENGKIWIGADGELWLWDPENNSKTVFLQDDKNPNSVPSTMIPCMAKDKSGSLWLITRGDGLAVAHDLKNPFELIGQMPIIQMMPLEENKVIIWTEQGVYTYNTQQKTLSPGGLPIGPFNGINPKLLKYSDEEILISEGNRSVPKLYNKKTGTVTFLPPARSNYNLQIAGGRIWDNLRYLDEQENKWVDAFPELQKNIPGFISSMTFFNDIIHDTGTSIWLSTTRGLFRYDLETKQSKQYHHDPDDPHGLPTVVCQLMYKGAGRQMYLTTTNGLAVYDPVKDHFNIYNQQNGLLHNVVETVVEDADGNPWIGTALGLQKLDLETGVFTDYDMNDGLPGEFINGQHSCRDSEGWLYFFSADKAFRFHPDSLPSRDYSVPVYLLDFFQNHLPVAVNAGDSILKKMLRYTPSLTLPFNKNDFGFSFSMPVFYKPEKTTYYYRLLPYQRDWLFAGNNREMHYTNMDPGRYTFQVKAKTVSGVWCTEEASVEIIILPPWYQTWWARTLFVLLLGGTTYFFYRQKLYRALEKAESQRLRDLHTLKSRLYTNITHEFRTPLTVIMGMTNNIRGHSQERKLIQRNSKNLLRLINQLLDLSKLDSGNLKMDKIQGDIVNYLQYLTESFYSMAEEKHIRLTFYPEVKGLIMDYDETKIQHIVYNLLTNAIKFTPEGGKVVLHINKLEKHGVDWLQIKVSDTGIGISKENLPQIFDRFYQGEGSSTRGEVGTGIGLALTKELVEMMGGRIAVESKLGAGTDFLILLPVICGTETPKLDVDGRRMSPEIGEQLAVSESLVPSLGISTFNKSAETPSLLIIEDNRDVVTYIESLLKKDYNIEIARDGQEGIDKALEMIPDIIISDVMMPEKNGYEVCQALKNDERSSHIPIILLTAKAATEDRIEGLKEGADAYLTKPFNKEELFIRLENLVELRKALQERYASNNYLLKQPGLKSESSLDDIFLQKLIKVVQERLDDPDLAVVHLCRAANLSNTQVNRKLKALTGKTPSQFIRSIRLQKALELLQTTDLNISEIAYDVGFNDPNYFSRSFSEEFGHPPNAIRK